MTINKDEFSTISCKIYRVSEPIPGLNYYFIEGYSQEVTKSDDVFSGLCQITLSKNNFSILKNLLKCDESEMQGKEISMVLYKGDYVLGIGYDGLYIPSYYNCGVDIEKPVDYDKFLRVLYSSDKFLEFFWRIHKGYRLPENTSPPVLYYGKSPQIEKYYGEENPPKGRR